MVSTLLTAAGDLTSTNAEQFLAQVLSALDRAGDAKCLELDLRAARIIDSVGLNLLVSLIKHMRARGGQVHVHVAHASVRRVLAFTRIDQHAEITLH